MPELPAVIHLPGPAVPTPEKRSRSGSEKRARGASMYVRLTDHERQELEGAAAAAGTEPGPYARQMALAEPEERGSAAHVTTRPTRLPFRVTDAERVRIEELADRAGLTPGSYVRARALKRPVTLTTRRPPVEKAELARLLGLVGNGTSNLNQIAARLNSGDDVAQAAILSAAATMQDASLAIIEALGRAPKPRDRR